MATSIWGPGQTIINVENAIRKIQSFTGTAGQVLFTFTSLTYVPGMNNLDVYINGQHQWIGRDYLETSPTSITLLEGVILGDIIDVVATLTIPI